LSTVGIFMLPATQSPDLPPDSRAHDHTANILESTMRQTGCSKSIPT
jgi:hypothetical protein